MDGGFRHFVRRQSRGCLSDTIAIRPAQAFDYFTPGIKIVISERIEIGHIDNNFVAAFFQGDALRIEATALRLEIYGAE